MQQTRLRYLFSILVAIPFFGGSVSAQTDTLRVMAYNVLNYGETPLCQGPNGYYHTYLETIVQYANPDIISLEKMGSIQTSPTDHNNSAVVGFQDSILQFALNAAYPGRFNYCMNTNFTGSNTECLLFYNQQKLGFISIVCTYSNTEDFDTYKLYYKDPNLATTHDTTYLYVTLNHDISGDGNESARGSQMVGEMAGIKRHFTHLPNMINMGDFNVRNSSEPAYAALVAGPDANFNFYDPPFYPDGSEAYPADWDSNPDIFTRFLTTSTRALSSVPNSCGTNGGAKDWYDHIFLSPWIVNNANYISYIHNSFRVIGNDGQRLSKSVNDPPTNTAVPSAVADALFQMSNKYPVMVDLLVTPNTSGTSQPDPEASAVTNLTLTADYASLANPVDSRFTINFSNSLMGQEVSFDCIDIVGRRRLHQVISVSGETMSIPCNLSPGTYYVRITRSTELICQSVVTKN
jgi:hypothetical protein